MIFASTQKRNTTAFKTDCIWSRTQLWIIFRSGRTGNLSGYKRPAQKSNEGRTALSTTLCTIINQVRLMQ